jgi:hypothetical protein
MQVFRCPARTGENQPGMSSRSSPAAARTASRSRTSPERSSPGHPGGRRGRAIPARRGRPASRRRLLGLVRDGRRQLKGRDRRRLREGSGGRSPHGVRAIHHPGGQPSGHQAERSAGEAEPGQGVRLTVAVAGHPLPLILRANGDMEEAGVGSHPTPSPIASRLPSPVSTNVGPTTSRCW